MGASNRRLPFASSSACGRLRGGGPTSQPAPAPLATNEIGHQLPHRGKARPIHPPSNIEHRNRCKGPVHHRPLVAACCFARSIDEPEANKSFHPPTQAGGIASFVAGFFTPSSLRRPARQQRISARRQRGGDSLAPCFHRSTDPAPSLAFLTPTDHFLDRQQALRGAATTARSLGQQTDSAGGQTGLTVRRRGYLTFNPRGKKGRPAFCVCGVSVWNECRCQLRLGLLMPPGLGASCVD